MAIAYIDECGCASIAGPAVVCAVAAEDGAEKVAEGIKDSKRLSKKQREVIVPLLMKTLEFEVVQVPVQRIEEINIHWAKYEGMKKAVINFIKRGIKIDKVIVDGKFKIPDLDIPQEAIVKADDKLWQVGAASILGKVSRDNYMTELGKQEKYSYYGFKNNSGYFSPEHRMGIILHGPSDIHREKFIYFKYCLDRHKEYKKIISRGDNPNIFLNRVVSGEDKKSDYSIWKNTKKNIWKPILS